MAHLIKKRNESDPAFQWKLNHLTASDEVWQHEYDGILQAIGGFVKHKDSMTRDAAALYACLTEKDTLSQSAGRLYVYANMKLHENSADSVYQGMADKAENMIVRLSSAVSFIEPALLSLDDSAFMRFREEEPRLSLYNHYFADLQRQKEHVLSPEMEEMLANTSEIGAAAETVFSMINNADIKFGIIKDENGEDSELTHGRYARFMESYDRRLRQEAFTAYYASYQKLKNTLAATYNASVKKDSFFAAARKYASALEAALSADNIPKDVYLHLIKAVHEALPEMHRYARLKKKALGVSELHIYDILTPIVAGVDTKCDFETAKSTVQAALAPLGAEYTKTLSEAFQNGWIDTYENEGKRSGAYSWGAYGCHPYVLLNFDNKIDDMFTLAHEMGHAMHSHYTWQTQPYVYGDYTTFLAEVASTVNEALLMNHLRETLTDPKMKAYLINYFLEQFRSIIFRQTMFAEFEMLTHQMSESGQPLTVESLGKLYRDLNEKYYGPDVVLDDQINMEWARIPHFYNAFYVFQYSTGFSAAIAFARRILEKGKPAVDDYINFLKSGSGDYSISILQKAGVDMASPEPVREALLLFSELLNDMEKPV